MKKDRIFDLLDKSKDLPKEINDGINNLFCVSSFKEMSIEQKKKIYNTMNMFFVKEGIVDYSKTVKEYTLFYLSVNFYKIWQPLVDLLEKNQLKNKIDVLDIGAGPGTSTFGLIEFYKQLAFDNGSIYFDISISLVEVEKEFLNVFDKLMNKYLSSFPKNLKVNIKTFNMKIDEYFDNYTTQYDLIIESNVLNSNENSVNLGFDYFAERFSKNLKKQSSLILIEPAREKEIRFLKKIKPFFEKNGLNIYSPCDCNNYTCNQFTNAMVDCSCISILKNALMYGLLEARKNIYNHYFEYFIYRNDKLKKNKFVIGKNKLCELNQFVSKRINFNASIIAFVNKEEKGIYSLKVCDGTLKDNQEVWIDIPYNTLKDADIISGRGDNIQVKYAYVLNNKRICCDIETIVRIEG